MLSLAQTAQSRACAVQYMMVSHMAWRSVLPCPALPCPGPGPSPLRLQISEQMHKALHKSLIAFVNVTILSALPAGTIMYAQAPHTICARRSKWAYAMHDDMMWYLGKSYRVMQSEGLIHKDQFRYLEPLLHVDDLASADKVSMALIVLLQAFLALAHRVTVLDLHCHVDIVRLCSV